MNELAQALIGESYAAPASRIIEGLSGELVHKKIPNVPHTIYEELWHIAFWQKITLDWIRGIETPFPDKPSDGFPSASAAAAETWEQLSRRFLQTAGQAAANAHDTRKLDEPIRCPSRPGMPLRIMSIRDQLISLAAHNAYHLGRIVLLRQLLQVWPPASGGYSCKAWKARHFICSTEIWQIGYPEAPVSYKGIPVSRFKPLQPTRRSVHNSRTAIAFPILALLLLAAPLFAQQSCKDLLNLQLPETAVTSATIVSTGSFTVPKSTATIGNLPAFCRVAATTKPAIRFEVWLPLRQWNGKFQGVGNGGTAGVISYRAMAAALRRGYAAASTDTGHVNTPPSNGFDSTWALHHPELVADFGYRSLHLTTVNGKQIAQAFYGKGPAHSYYVGCSKGGEQGLMEAQRFPDDYDGLVVGDPANNWTRHYAGAHLWYSIATLKDPESYIPASKVPLLANAVIAACDAIDGVADGVLEDPRKCHFDPTVLTCKAGQLPSSCFTPKQVKAIKDIWGGAHDSRGNLIYPGILPGGEDGTGGWSSWITGNKPFAATHWKAADGFFQDMVFEDPSYNALNFNYDTDMKAALAKTSRSLDAVDPDLRPLQRRGGKLILYHGWSDPDISPLNTINYYNQVQATVGRDTSQFLRLFMVPGMNHCAGGPGPSHFDGVTALEQWVEDGVAPEKIVAFHTTEGEIDRTRPLCPYPQVAVYSGKGSTNEASNFACRMPAK